MNASQLAPSPEPGKPATVAAMHDFAAKLLQPSLIGRLKDYVRWQVARRGAGGAASLCREASLR